MNIADNILKHHLKNVYFLCGTACGGKTTISKALSSKYGFLLYDEDLGFSASKVIADTLHQPATTTVFPSWDYYFNRPYKEYHKWLNDSITEQVQIVLIELIQLSQNQKVVVDMHMPIEIARQITEYNQIVFLVAEPEMVTKDYYLRPDHINLYNCIMSLEEPQKALDNCSKSLEYGTRLFLNELYKSDVFYIKREQTSTVENTLFLVEQHFGLS